MTAAVIVLAVVAAVVVMGIVPLHRRLGEIAAASEAVEHADARAAILEHRLRHQRELVGPRPNAALVREIARSEAAVSEALIAYNDAVAAYARTARPLRGWPGIAATPAIYVPPEAA